MITITGATGNTGSGIADILLDHGEHVRVVGRSGERLEKYRLKGAEVAVGDQGDVDFLTGTLYDSKAIYLLIPPKADAENIRMYYNNLGKAAVTALQRSGIRKVVFLSSLGAEKPSGTGPVTGLHDVEEMLGNLTDVDIVFLRCGYFMENILGNLEMASKKAIIGAPMQADSRIPMVATADIAATAAEFLMNRTFRGHSITEIVGDRMSFAEMTAIIGTILEIPHLTYVHVNDDDMMTSFLAMGLSRSVAASYVELMHAVADGLINTTQFDRLELSAPTRFTQFAENVLKPAFMAMQHSVPA